jgi:tetratricopeptide (TPR) repeat protein
MNTPWLSPRRLPSVLVLLAALGCGTVTVRVPVMRPAEVNMAPYQSVGVGKVEFSGDTGGRGLLGAQLEQKLVDSQRFQVVDRKRMDDVLRELSLSASDLADPSRAAKLGGLIAAGALIYGDVKENYSERSGQDRFKDKEGKVHTRYKIEGTAKVKANFRVIDVTTGRLVVSKVYTDNKLDANSAVDQDPNPLDRDTIVQRARDAVLDRFMKAIVPHQEFENARFEKDGDLPQLEGAIGWAERGDWKKAQEGFSDAINAAKNNPKIKSPILAMAYWDLGLAYEYAGDYDKAIKMVEEAQKVSGNFNYLDEIKHIKQMQADAKKLAEQTQATDAASEGK